VVAQDGRGNLVYSLIERQHTAIILQWWDACHPNLIHFSRTGATGAQRQPARIAQLTVRLEWTSVPAPAHYLKSQRAGGSAPECLDSFAVLSITRSPTPGEYKSCQSPRSFRYGALRTSP